MQLLDYKNCPSATIIQLSTAKMAITAALMLLKSDFSNKHIYIF